VFILKVVKVLCFDTLLEVFILKVVRGFLFGTFRGVDSKAVSQTSPVSSDRSIQGALRYPGEAWTDDGAPSGHGSLQ